jgi:hypothetical protein
MPDLDRTFVFAARRSRFGKPSDLSAPSFDLGFNLDCGDHGADGVPLLCLPSSTTGWRALPQGIDDALLVRVLAPAYEAEAQGPSIDLDAEVSHALEHGGYGVLVSIRGWNGTPDDSSVEVTVRTSPGLASGAMPKWSGADTWSPYPDVDDDGLRPFAFDSLPGYVANGTLVVDATRSGAQLFRFGPQGASFTLLVSDLSFVGALTQGAIQNFLVSGVIDQPSAAGAAVALRAALGACNGGAVGALLDAMAASVPTAADLPFVPGADPSARCDGISFGWALDAEPALLADVPGAATHGQMQMVGCH